MIVAVSCPYFYPRIGGVERYAYNISRRLAPLTGNDVYVVTSDMGDEGEVPYDETGLCVIKERQWYRMSSTPVNPLWVSSISKLIKSHRITHTLTHTPVPYMSEVTILASKLNNTPCVITCHEDIENRDPLINMIFLAYFQLFQKRGFAAADRMIMTSDRLARNSRHLNLFLDKTSIIPPGVDASVFNPDLNSEWLSSKYGLWGREIVLFVGQMHKASARKGIDVLIQAFKHVVNARKHAHLMFVGDGNMRGEYEAFAHRTLPRGSYTFCGMVPEDVLPLYYRGAALTVLPSVISEGFGMSLVEAAACGRPTVASNIGGIPLAVQNGITGILVSPGDVSNLAASISTVLSDESLARRMGESGRRRVVELFDWDVLAHRTYEVLARI